MALFDRFIVRTLYLVELGKIVYEHQQALVLVELGKLVYEHQPISVQRSLIVVLIAVL